MKKNQKQAIAIGAGVAAIAAAAAGTYFFAGKHGAKNRKKVSQWADKAKKEVMKEVSKMEKVSKETYGKAVDNVMKQYKAVKSIDNKDVVAMAGELKSHWNAIAKEVGAMSSQVKKAVNKATKKPIKKVAKKVVKKVAKKSNKRR